MKAVTLRVRKIYFDKIVAGTKTFELRKYSEYWKKRLIGNAPGIATFVCGKQVHRRRIVGVAFVRPEWVVGRPLSEAEKKDIPTEYCYVIHLGEIKEGCKR